MVKKKTKPTESSMEQLRALVASRRQRVAEENGMDCEANIIYQDSLHATVYFWTGSTQRTAYYEFGSEGWYCSRDWLD